jgi:hypothetical protein
MFQPRILSSEMKVLQVFAVFVKKVHREPVNRTVLGGSNKLKKRTNSRPKQKSGEDK